jgi:hypothetical protein
MEDKIGNYIHINADELLARGWDTQIPVAAIPLPSGIPVVPPASIVAGFSVMGFILRKRR